MTLNDYRDRINQVLEQLLPPATQKPQHLHAAMRYAVLNGGKRLRPLLVYGTWDAIINKRAIRESPLPVDTAACAVELVHCYSLIHDDLPAMDNDDVRRGKPSCHKAFDEATAILAGDALFNLAFEILANGRGDSRIAPTLILTLARASGSLGMAGGQMLGLEATNKQLSLAQLEQIYKLKTGCLIRASVRMGALVANATPKQLAILDKYAECFGLAFQIQDDIADHDKTDEPNYVNLLGLSAAKNKLQELQQQMLQHLQDLDFDAQLLIDLINIVRLPH